MKRIIEKDVGSGVGTWRFPSVVNWVMADLNVSMWLIVRKGRGLSEQNDWRSPANIKFVETSLLHWEMDL